MDLLHHEVLIAGLLRCLCIPVDRLWRLFDLIAVQIKKYDLALADTRHFQIPDIINVSCVFQYCRNIRCNIRLTVFYTEYHRAVLAGHINFSRIVLEHDRQRIGATNTDHGMVDRIDRCTKVFPIIIVDQLYRHLSICLRIKRIAIADQLILQFLIILDDTVVYSHDIPVITDMRMCIIL